MKTSKSNRPFGVYQCNVPSLEGKVTAPIDKVIRKHTGSYLLLHTAAPGSGLPFGLCHGDSLQRVCPWPSLTLKEHGHTVVTLTTCSSMNSGTAIMDRFRGALTTDLRPTISSLVK